MSKYTATSPSSQVYIYNPVDWDPKDSLPTELHDHTDAARYFLHRIFMGRIIDRSHRDSLVPLKAQYMRQVITDPDVYMQVKESLRASGTIVTDNQFIVGSKCKSYGLGKKLRNRKHVRTEVSDKFICKRIIDLRKKDAERPTSDVYDFLKSWLKKVTIDKDEAMSHIFFNNQFNEHFDGRHEISVNMIHDQDWF